MKKLELTELQKIPILFASNEKYAPYLYVAIKSLIANTNIENYYEIIVLSSDISNKNKQIIKNLDKNNINIKFIDTENILNEYNLKTEFYTCAHFSPENYLRFFIPDILKNYSKVIYLDCDICIKSDIANLYNVDIGDKIIGASHSFGMVTNYYSNDETKNYINNILNMNSVDNYINTGVMIMNLEKMRKTNLLSKLLSALDNIKEPKCVDQCIYNSVCENDFYFIEPNWNFTWNPYPKGYEKTLSILPEKIKQKYIQAKRTPYIIHYITERKPWNTLIAYSYIWWFYALQTSFRFKFIKDLNSIKKLNLTDKLFSIKNEYKEEKKYKVLNICGVTIRTTPKKTAR